MGLPTPREGWSGTIHAPTFIAGGVIHIEDAGGVVQGGSPLHPADGPPQPADLLLCTRVVSHHLQGDS